MKDNQDILIGVALFVVTLAAFIFVADPAKLEVVKMLLTGSFGAVITMLQAKVRQTLKGDVVDKKVEINK